MGIPQFNDLTVLRMQVMNVKRARLIDITPTEVITKIAGKNRQGKTSFMNGVEWLFGGKAKIQMEPIHRGQQVGRLYAELGKEGGPVELLVTRTLRMVDDVEWTTSVTIETPSGATFGKAQTLLDALAGNLSFDPSLFWKMKPREQFDALRSFVPDYDFDLNKSLNDGDYKKRTDINRDADKALKAASLILVRQGTPDEPIDVSELGAQLEAAGEHNTQIVRRRNNRTIKQNEADALRVQAESHRRRAAQLRAEADEQDVLAEQTLVDATAIDQMIAEAPDLPEPKSTEAIRRQIDDANVINAAVAEKQRKARLIAEAKEYEWQSDELTARMVEREQAKRDAIAKGHLPVDGLGFGDGCITLNGFPLDQASTAESIDACVSIAMALNPTLKVILIRDGSSLDSEMRERIALRAGEKGYRVFMECVDNEGGERITIEDGVVKGAPPPPEEDAASRPRKSLGSRGAQA